MAEFFNPIDAVGWRGLCAGNPIGSIGSRFIDLKLPIHVVETGSRALASARYVRMCIFLFATSARVFRQELESGLIEDYRR